MTGQKVKLITNYLFLTRSRLYHGQSTFGTSGAPLFDAVSDMFWYFTLFLALISHGGMGLEPVSALYLLGLGMFGSVFSDIMLTKRQVLATLLGIFLSLSVTLPDTLYAARSWRPI